MPARREAPVAGLPDGALVRGLRGCAAEWMVAGFTRGAQHGHMSLAGESCELRPFAFLEDLGIQASRAYFDQNGLTPYGQRR